MLKNIPKSDINLRPFKVYKNFTLNGNGNTAYNHTGSIDVLNESQSFENGLWHQLHTMYYRDPHNVYTSYGTIKPTYTSVERASQRILNNTAYVYSIPQTKYGEGIQPFSIEMTSNLLNETIKDDGYGNLYSNYNSYTFIQINIENELFLFEDPNGTEISATLISIDLENNIFQIQNENTFYLLRVDVETSFISWLGEFNSIQVNPVIIGNAFYSHGIITITRDTEAGRFNMIDYDSTIKYRSTNTIYENEILLIVGEDEFNVSTNPTTYTELNIETGSITTTYEGTKQYKTSDKYQKPIFTEYEYSSSIDPIGSYLAPYITTIGLYDDNMDMVAVAKLAKPVKSMPDLPVNFLVRFDS